VKVTDRRTNVDFAYGLKDLLTVHDPHVERVTMVMDHLKTQHPSALDAAFAPADAK
jgi:hypothetical protein